MKKAELYKLFGCHNLIRSYERQLERLDTLKSFEYGERVQTSHKKGSSVEDSAIKSIELKRVLIKEINYLIGLSLKAKEDFKVLDNRERAVLELRYLEGLEWKDISRELCYSEQHVYKLHGQALKKMRVNDSK
ncbi:sigma factor-like helix-turn-helix DNA-binding protein [Lagierella sp. ICN-221743]